MAEQSSSKAIMAAGRLKRCLDRAKLATPALSSMAAPKSQEIASLKALLNECMALRGEPAELAEDLWDALGFSKAEIFALPADESDPTVASIDRAKSEISAREQEAEKERKVRADEAKEKAKAEPAKKGGLFGWLGSEKPKKDEDDDDDEDDGRYKGGLR